MPIAVAALGIVAYAWWVTGLEPFSVLATGAVVGAGVAAAVFGHLRLPRHRPVTGGAARRAAVRWSAVVAALAAWQLVAWLQEPRAEHPTLSSLANAALDARPVRAAAVAAWLLGAAWLGRR